MNRSELITAVRVQVKSLTNYLVDGDYKEAINNAERDTGFALPVSTSFQIKWMILRTKRHLFDFLLSESAHKFKFEQINLQHRFDHYKILVAQMDKDFEKALEDNLHEFAGVDASHLFGTKIDAGFSSEAQTGRDTTYGEDNQVIFEPNENS